MQDKRPVSIDLTRRQVLVVLCGVLEFDGRALRMIDVLESIGCVTVVDFSSARDGDRKAVSSVERIGVDLPPSCSKARRHLALLGAAVRQAARCRPQVVIAENYLTAGTALFVSSLFRARLVYDAYELIIPEADVKMSRRDRFWYVMERIVVRSADLVIAANADRARLMVQHYGLRRAPLIMRNIPQSRQYETTKISVRERYPELGQGRHRERLVLYQGDVSLSRGLGRFLDAFRHLPPTYRFLVVGDGPDLQRLIDMARVLKSEGRFSALGRIANSVLPTVTSLADVGIVTYPFVGLNNIYCAPNKIYEYAQAGVPVVATNQPPLARIIEAYGIGVCVGETEGAELLAAAIQAVAERGRDEYAASLRRFLDDDVSLEEPLRVKAEISSLLMSPSGARERP